VQAMLATQNNEMAKSGEISTHCLIKLTEYVRLLPTEKREKRREKRREEERREEKRALLFI